MARLVAQGLRGTHEWTAEKGTLLEAFEQSGITAVFMDPEQGGFLAGPKNLALALTAFELAWVDGGAATLRDLQADCRNRSVQTRWAPDECPEAILKPKKQGRTLHIALWVVSAARAGRGCHYPARVCRRYPATSPTKRCTDASAMRWPTIAFMVFPTAPNGGS